MLLYIHIPYCDSKCYYCSFNSYVDKFDTRERYMKALQEQIEFELTRFATREGEIETIFIGGGTPSTVHPKLYAPIFELLKPYRGEDIEITTEANPNSATREWLEGMRGLGVNRISFGVQSFDPQKLKALNRAHSPSDSILAINTAKEVGFDHISLDLIYNYAGDTKELLTHDIEQAFKLPIDHISAYELTIEGGTKFASTPKARQEDDEIAFFVANEIEKHGFSQYEISNFGRYQSRHNIGYWRLTDYIGAGAGAVGFQQNSRYYPTTDIDSFIASPTHTTVEKLTPEELHTERVFLGLRSLVGVDESILDSTMRARARVLLEENKLEYTDGIYYNPNYFLSDELALFLLK